MSLCLRQNSKLFVLCSTKYQSIETRLPRPLWPSWCCSEARAGGPWQVSLPLSLHLRQICVTSGEWTGPISTRACPSSSAEQTTGRSSCGGWTITRWVFTAVCQVFWLIWFATSALTLLGQKSMLKFSDLVLIVPVWWAGGGTQCTGEGRRECCKIASKYRDKTEHRDIGMLNLSWSVVVRKEHFSSRLTTYRLLASHLSLLFFSMFGLSSLREPLDCLSIIKIKLWWWPDICTVQKILTNPPLKGVGGGHL